METKTIVNRIVEDSNGNQINRNDVVEMLVDGRIIVGRFLGIGSRGAWISPARLRILITYNFRFHQEQLSICIC